MNTKRRSRRNFAGVARVHNPSSVALELAAAKRVRNAKRGKKSSKQHKRRRNAATVQTAARALSSASRPNPSRRPARRRNPSRRTASFGALRNPRNVRGGSFVATGLTALGVVGVEMVAQNILGPQSGIRGALVKGALGYVIAEHGQKVPLIGKHSDVIGGGLMLLAAVDLMRLVVVPRAIQYLPQVPGITAPLGTSFFGDGGMPGPASVGAGVGAVDYF